MKAKKKITRLWSILLALVMVAGMLPTVALAADATADFTVDANAAITALGGSDKATWVSDTKTLTLKGVDFTTTAATAVILPDGATIVLNGDNTITGGDSTSGSCYGIYAAGSLTIQGSGTLTVNGGDAKYNSYGIYAYPGNVTIDGGTVTAKGGKTTDYYSYGIASDTVIIKGTANVTAEGGEAEGNSYGIVSATVIINDTANVTAKGGEAEGNSYGIKASSDITISNSTVTATGGTATNGTSYGIYSADKITISDSTVIATGGTALKNYGIYTDYMDIRSGKITATAGTATNESYGIYLDVYTTDITGGTVTAKGGTVTASGGKCFGIYENLSNYVYIYIKNTATVTAVCGTATDGNNYSINPYYSDYSATYGNKITFNGNGGTGIGEMQAFTGSTGIDYTLPDNVFTAPSGMQFKGWAESADGEVISTATINVTDNTTLYAIWESIPATTYTVSFDANGGSGTMTAVTGVSGDYTLLI